jgi:NAD(P)-dependent dehydrogenase (short-subunit alcohol dehydrogenase family)
MKFNIDTVIFITGAGSGFGLECVKKFYALGTKVVVADISLTQDAKDFLAQADHKRILVLDKFDVTNEEAVQRDV